MRTFRRQERITQPLSGRGCDRHALKSFSGASRSPPVAIHPDTSTMSSAHLPHERMRNDDGPSTLTTSIFGISLPCGRSRIGRFASCRRSIHPTSTKPLDGAPPNMCGCPPTSSNIRPPTKWTRSPARLEACRCETIDAMVPAIWEKPRMVFARGRPRRSDTPIP
jgi:hypothetical protein